jgi:hypothetical protein
LAGFWEIAYDEAVDAFVYFKFVFALPVSALFEQGVAFVDVLFYLGVVLLQEVDRDEFEGDVHFLADFDGVFQGQVVGCDGLWETFVVVVELGLGEQGVADLGLAEVVFGVFDFEVEVGQQFVEGLLDLHDLNYF